MANVHDVAMTREEMLRRYEEYLSVCNRHAWDELAPFLSDHVMVNSRRRTPTEYSLDMQVLSLAFPDYRWQMRRAVVEGHWLAVHLHDTGTRRGPFGDAPGDGRTVETEEFAMYHFNELGRITEVEVTADNAPLRAGGI